MSGLYLTNHAGLYLIEPTEFNMVFLIKSVVVPHHRLLKKPLAAGECFHGKT